MRWHVHDMANTHEHTFEHDTFLHTTIVEMPINEAVTAAADVSALIRLK